MSELEPLSPKHPNSRSINTASRASLSLRPKYRTSRFPHDAVSREASIRAARPGRVSANSVQRPPAYGCTRRRLIIISTLATAKCVSASSWSCEKLCMRHGAACQGCPCPCPCPCPCCKCVHGVAVSHELKLKGGLQHAGSRPRVAGRYRGPSAVAMGVGRRRHSSETHA